MPSIFAYYQKVASDTPSGMEKKRDSAAKRTDLKAPGNRRQLRKDHFSAGPIRKYGQILLPAESYNNKRIPGTCVVPPIWVSVRSAARSLSKLPDIGRSDSALPSAARNGGHRTRDK